MPDTPPPASSDAAAPPAAAAPSADAAAPSADAAAPSADAAAPSADAAAPAADATAPGDGAPSDAAFDASLTPSAEDTPPTAGRKKFGTFGGVFTPTLLTILGVIMYLREGWVIGNAGLVGGLAIMLLAFGITICTALAMSSITTNIRIGAGGRICHHLAVAGAGGGRQRGIPRYLSQALAVTMYIFGFREGWLYIFPEHPALLIDVSVFARALRHRVRQRRLRHSACNTSSWPSSSARSSPSAWRPATGSMQYGLGEVQLWGDFMPGHRRTV